MIRSHGKATPHTATIAQKGHHFLADICSSDRMVRCAYSDNSLSPPSPGLFLQWICRGRVDRCSRAYTTSLQASGDLCCVKYKLITRDQEISHSVSISLLCRVHCSFGSDDYKAQMKDAKCELDKVGEGPILCAVGPRWSWCEAFLNCHFWPCAGSKRPLGLKHCKLLSRGILVSFCCLVFLPHSYLNSVKIYMV